MAVGETNKDESEQRAVSYIKKIIPFSEQLSLEKDAQKTKMFEKEFLRADENTTEIVLFFCLQSLLSGPLLTDSPIAS